MSVARHYGDLRLSYMTNNGTADLVVLSPQANNTVIVSYGRENVFSVDDGDTSAITFFEIIQYNPTTFQGKGIVGAVFDNNATGSLAPFNGMLVVGTHDENPSTQTVTIRLWEWQGWIPTPPAATATDMQSPFSNEHNNNNNYRCYYSSEQEEEELIDGWDLNPRPQQCKGRL